MHTFWIKHRIVPHFLRGVFTLFSSQSHTVRWTVLFPFLIDTYFFLSERKNQCNCDIWGTIGSSGIVTIWMCTIWLIIPVYNTCFLLFFPRRSWNFNVKSFIRRVWVPIFFFFIWEWVPSTPEAELACRSLALELWWKRKCYKHGCHVDRNCPFASLCPREAELINILSGPGI